MALAKNYYAGSNTYLGFYSLYEDAFRDLDYLYILKGGPGTGKSSLMRDIGIKMLNNNYNIEFYHCSSDNQSLDGLIIPQLNLGFVDGTAPHIIDPIYPGAVDQIINLGDFWDRNRLRENKEDIKHLTKKISSNFVEAYQQFNKAKEVYDEWKGIYLSAIDFNKVNMVTEKLTEEIFDQEILREGNPKTKRLFFGAITPEGPVNYINNITKDIKKRYIVKGRPGSGKSIMMKKIGMQAESLGLSVVYYPSAFDPNSLDMVIIPSLSVAIIDGTAPHIINPERDNDKVIDMFELCMDQQIEKLNEGKLENIEQRYKIKMTIGTNHLKEAKRLHDELEKFYISSMNFEKISMKKDELMDEVFDYASKIM